MRLRSFACLLTALSALAAARAHAQAQVPDALKPWRDWVLHGQEFRRCPALNGSRRDLPASHVCAWPGRLDVVVDSNGARFEQRWTVYSEDWVPLPGDADHWPTDVRVDDQPLPVVARNGLPALRLTSGSHRVAGRLTWSLRPASIRIPREAALVSLRVDGQSIARPTIEQSTLWLGLRPDAVAEEDRLDVNVYRRLSDTLPMRLATAVELDIAGQSREVDLQGALLAGFVGESLDSDLPAQLDPDGRLRVQVRPGHWTLMLTAHAPAPLSSIAIPAAAAPWPAEEIWSFEAQPRLRVAALSDAPAVDPERTGVPQDWRSLPSYRVAAGRSVSIVERSRVDAAEANRLVLHRDLWLDFDGRAFTALDAVQGTMHSRWRLDMAAPYTLTMAAIDEQNLLITRGSEPDSQGVELRAPGVALTATSRVPAGGALPVTGYDESFDQAQTTLHVPPGVRLLAAPGADRADGAWLERWRLLDVFLLLVIVAGAWRLFGASGGLVALTAMVLTFHEPMAPRWAWLNVLLAVALLRVAPAGRLRWICTRYRLVSLAALVIVLIPFGTLELRATLFPQLERAALQRGITSTSSDRLFASPAGSMRRAMPQTPPPGAAGAARKDALEEVTVTGTRLERNVPRYLPGALVQTGPGLPDWDWTRYTLRFSGPIAVDDTYRLILLGLWSVRAWRAASVALALLLLWLIAGRPARAPGGLARGASGIAALLAAAALSPTPGRAQDAAQYPPPALLEELKNRLIEPAPCSPSCAELTRAHVEIAGAMLDVSLEVAAQDAVAVPMPGALRGWRPESMTVDGTPVELLFRDRADTAWLRVAAGVHRVVLSGTLPATDGVSLPFPLRPRFIEVTAPGWDVTGVNDGRLRSGALELVRRRNAAAGGPSATAFPPYVRVVRRLDFALDWTAETTVERVAPATRAFTLQVDLLPNEAVITPGIDVAGGRANVAFAAGQDTVEWRSRLPTTDRLRLTAAAERPWSESWQFVVGDLWHADFAGLPASPPQTPDPAFWVPEYYPRPGETLTVGLRQPEPAGGDTIAIDTVDYTRDVGRRVSSYALSFTYRSTRGGEHMLTLPDGGSLDAVTIDGKPVPLQLEADRLGVPVTPGRHAVNVRWRSADGIAVRSALPVVELGSGATNLRATLHLADDRWILFTFGPTLGPAVLYWPELIVFALAAWALGRLPSSPLRGREWFLLGSGLSTFAWPVLGLFAVWAFALSWRGRTPGPSSARRFKAMQVGLGILTVAALAALIGAIPIGLLGRPDMQLASPVDPGVLSWFSDRSSGATPTAGALSVSLWFYKAAMLAWALWLSFALLRWLPWAWRAFTHDGAWRGRIAVDEPASGRGLGQAG